MSKVDILPIAKDRGFTAGFDNESRKLRKLRKTLGISRIDELTEDKKRKANERLEQKARELAELRKNMTHSFAKGQSYFIFDSDNAKGDSEYMKTETGKDCIFVYIRKEGKHHVFREKRGGWIRTYTDIQLMGKNIKEVTV